MGGHDQGKYKAKQTLEYRQTVDRGGTRVK
jgi:hypothetical protein